MDAKEIAELTNEYSKNNLDSGAVLQLEQAIKDYAKQKCKEQRELCQECVDDGYFEMITAPEPDME